MTSTLQAAYDVKDGSYNPLDPDWRRQFDAWACEQGIDLNAAYRAEIHLLDCLFVRVFQYELDEDGRTFYDPATCDAARRKPYDVVISEMPPVKPAKETA